MKKLFLFACSLALTLSASAEQALFDGVVIVGGAGTAETPQTYDAPVIYNAPVFYGGDVVYNGPVIYNVGASALRSCLNACTGWYYAEPCAGCSYRWVTSSHGDYSWLQQRSAPQVIRFGEIQAARYGYRFNSPR